MRIMALASGGSPKTKTSQSCDDQLPQYRVVTTVVFAARGKVQ